jgi:hypothetical protein
MIADIWQWSRSEIDASPHRLLAAGLISGEATCRQFFFISSELYSVGGVQPFLGAGANAAEFRISPRPVPHPGAGKFMFLPPLAVK